MAVQVAGLGIGACQGQLAEIKARMGEPPWSMRIVATDEMHGILICQPPGYLCDTHYHLHDEWWVVMQGEIDWYIEGEAAPVRARAGDIVFGPKDRYHHIRPVGSEPTIRLAIKEPAEFHRYDRPGCGPAGSPEQWRPER